MSAVLTFDVAAFRTSFPQFTVLKYPDAVLQGYWDSAICYISAQNCGWLRGTCRQRALNLMVAHLATLMDQIAAGITPGQVESATVDKVSVSLKTAPDVNQWQWWLGLTGYGQQLLALLSVKSVGGFYIGGLPEISALRKTYGIY